MFLFFGNYINDLAYNGKYNQWQNININIYFIIIGISQFFNGIIHWIILSKGTHKLLISYIKFMSAQIPIIILIALLYFKGISPDINKITFFVMIIALLKLLLSILVISKIKLFKNI